MADVDQAGLRKSSKVLARNIERVQDALGKPILIDDHGSEVRAAAWPLYEGLVMVLEAFPTLIEWDPRLPGLAVRLAGLSQQFHARAERRSSALHRPPPTHQPITQTMTLSQRQA